MGTLHWNAFICCNRGMGIFFRHFREKSNGKAPTAILQTLHVACLACKMCNAIIITLCVCVCVECHAANVCLSVCNFKIFRRAVPAHSKIPFTIFCSLSLALALYLIKCAIHCCLFNCIPCKSLLYVGFGCALHSAHTHSFCSFLLKHFCVRVGIVMLLRMRLCMLVKWSMKLT